MLQLKRIWLSDIASKGAVYITVTNGDIPGTKRVCKRNESKIVTRETEIGLLHANNITCKYTRTTRRSGASTAFL